MTHNQYFVLMKTHDFFTPELIEKTIAELKKKKYDRKSDVFARNYLIYTVQLLRDCPEIFPFGDEIRFKQCVEGVTLYDENPNTIMKLLTNTQTDEKSMNDIMAIASNGFAHKIKWMQEDIQKCHENIQALNDKMNVQAIQTFKERNTSAPLSDYKTNIITLKEQYTKDIKTYQNMMVEWQRLASIRADWFNKLDATKKQLIKTGVVNAQTRPDLLELKNLLYR